MAHDVSKTRSGLTGTNPELFGRKQKFSRLIHLLYVPTMFCNLGCQYCYLGSQTDHKNPDIDEKKALDTLTYALKKFTNEGVLPFNVSLHGGEVTSMSPAVLEKLFQVIDRYYLDYMDELQANNFRKINPHIKTNLYNFDRFYDLMCHYKVSISASVDLPLFLHQKYRTTKKGQSSLDKVLNNLSLLSKYPHHTKMSSTLFEEHIDNTDALIADIRKLHHEVGFDMNNFNFMFGFNSAQNLDKLIQNGRAPMMPVSEEKQVRFYQRMKAEFVGTDLEYGFRRHWFDEFMPSYCTCAENCGERFFLLQADGNLYACVRGQGVEAFYHGNIYKDEVSTILGKAKSNVATMHQKTGFHEDCQVCDYLEICHSGCAFVKNEINSGKSYTCALQKEIYKDNPVSYPPAKNKEHQKLVSENYKFNMHPGMVAEKAAQKAIRFRLPNDLYDAKNKLLSIIEEDPILKNMYGQDNMFLEFNDDLYPLTSQILKVERTILDIFEGDPLKLHISKAIFEANTKEPLTNTLYLQMLRDTLVVYGDEKRTKQEHIFTYQIFYNQLEVSRLKGDGFLEFDLAGLLNIHSKHFMDQVLNNLFVTTDSLRNYHYQKQKANAFYHIQAINLPFQNIEFYWNKAL
jgi:uncharacterized protein